MELLLLSLLTFGLLGGSGSSSSKKSHNKARETI